MGDDAASPALRVSVVDGRGVRVRGTGLEGWLRRIAPRAARGTVTIALVSDPRMRALNRQYRDKDYATDVLSFPSAPGSGLQVPGSRLRASGSGPMPGARGRRLVSRDADQRLPDARHDPGARSQEPGAGTYRTPAPGTGHRTLAPGTGHRAPLPVHLGDIVIARGVAARQARDAGHPLTTELRVLALHGLLHLLGYDHERDDGRMWRLEIRLRRRGGLDTGLMERETSR